MVGHKTHPFNTYLRKHYNYKKSVEEEIRTQIYSNKETNDFISMVTILKSVWFKVKAELNTLVIQGKIYLEVTVRYFQQVASEEVNELTTNLRKQLSKDNILIRTKAVSEETFSNIRSKEL